MPSENKGIIDNAAYQTNRDEYRYSRWIPAIAIASDLLSDLVVSRRKTCGR